MLVQSGGGFPQYYIVQPVGVFFSLGRVAGFIPGTTTCLNSFEQDQCATSAVSRYGCSQKRSMFLTIKEVTFALSLIMNSSRYSKLCSPPMSFIRGSRCTVCNRSRVKLPKPMILTPAQCILHSAHRGYRTLQP